MKEKANKIQNYKKRFLGLLEKMEEIDNELLDKIEEIDKVRRENEIMQLLLAYVTPITTLLHRVLQLNKTIALMKGISINKIETLETDLTKVSSDFREAVIKLPLTSKSLFLISEFTLIRNRITLEAISLLTLEKPISLPALSDIETRVGFLGLNSNWVSSVVALQLQEVSVIITSKKLGIDLNKETVAKILGKKFSKDETLSFNQRYEAFSEEMKRRNINMPKLTSDLRKMRQRVLHEGYNPTPEETKAILQFTAGLLDKLCPLSKN